MIKEEDELDHTITERDNLRTPINNPIRRTTNHEIL